MSATRGWITVVAVMVAAVACVPVNLVPTSAYQPPVTPGPYAELTLTRSDGTPVAT